MANLLDPYREQLLKEWEPVQQPPPQPAFLGDQQDQTAPATTAPTTSLTGTTAPTAPTQTWAAEQQVTAPTADQFATVRTGLIPRDFGDKLATFDPARFGKPLAPGQGAPTVTPPPSVEDVPTFEPGATLDMERINQFGDDMERRALVNLSATIPHLTEQARIQANAIGQSGSGLENALVMTALQTGNAAYAQNLRNIADKQFQMFQDSQKNIGDQSNYLQRQKDVAWSIPPSESNPYGGFNRAVELENRDRALRGDEPLTQEEIDGMWTSFQEDHRIINDVLSEARGFWDFAVPPGSFDAAGYSNIQNYETGGYLTQQEYDGFLRSWWMWYILNGTPDTMPRPPFMSDEEYERYSRSIDVEEPEGIEEIEEVEERTPLVGDTAGTEDAPIKTIVGPSYTPPGVVPETEATTVAISSPEQGTVDVFGRSISQNSVPRGYRLRGSAGLRPMPTSMVLEYQQNAAPGESMLDYAKRVHWDDEAWWEPI